MKVLTKTILGYLFATSFLLLATIVNANAFGYAELIEEKCQNVSHFEQKSCYNLNLNNK